MPLGSRRTLGICTVILAQLDCPGHSLLQLFSTNTALISDYLLPMPLQSLRSGELIAPYDLRICLRRDHAWGNDVCADRWMDGTMAHDAEPSS